MKQEVSVELAGGKSISFETGKLAKQAHGSVVVRIGDNVVLATATANPDPREGIDFFPLTVDYREYTYAGGRIPGGFIKREGRPSEREILTSRQIDRPVRPLFPGRLPLRDSGHRLRSLRRHRKRSRRRRHQRRIGRADHLRHSVRRPHRRGARGPGQWRIRHQPDLHRNAREPAEHHGGRHCRRHRDDRVRRQGSEGRNGGGRHRIRPHRNQEDLRRHQRPASKRQGSRSAQVTPPEFDQAYYDDLKNRVGSDLTDRLDTEKHPKAESYTLVRELKKQLQAAIPEDDEAAQKKLKTYYETLRERIFREQVINKKRRPDGRAFDQIRDIWIEVGVLPRTHGSAIFTRGETQALVTTTLGTSDDMQRLEVFEGEAKKRFMLHYNFPPFSVGEVAFLRGAGRREIGHGALAERAICERPAGRRQLALCHARGLRHSGIERFVVHGDGLRSFAVAHGRRRSAEVSGCRSSHGTGQGRRAIRHPDRHRGRRRPLRRHGFQSRRHQRRHHRPADGHQGRRHHRADHARSVVPGPARPSATFWKR